MASPNNLVPPLRLTNPFEGQPVKKLPFGLSLPIHEYFFCHILAGKWGVITTITNIFYKKLYEHCVEIEKIPSVYSDDGPAIIAGVLAKLNFNEPVPCSPEPSPCNPNPEPTPPRRRANPGPAKPKNKPAPNNRKPRAAGRSGKASPRASGETPEVEAPDLGARSESEESSD